MLIIGMDFDTKDNDLCQAHCIMHIQWSVTAQIQTLEKRFSNRETLFNYGNVSGSSEGAIIFWYRKANL